MKYENATTLVMLNHKADASRACRRLRDHGIAAGVRGERGSWEVFGFVPERLGADGMKNLVDKVLDERRGG